MKSRKKKTLPVRAKRYKKKLSNNLDYNDLEPRHLLAADLAPMLSFAGNNTDLITLTKPVALSESVDILRAQLNLQQNESLKLQTMWTDQIGFEHFKYQQYFNNILIEGSNYSLHVKDSLIVSMSGDQVQLTSPITDVQLTNAEALEHAMEHIGSERYIWQDEFMSQKLGFDGPPEGELVYITSDEGVSIPTFKFDMYTLDLGSRDYVYVNANTGVIEATESRIRDFDIDATGESLYNGVVSFIADQVTDSEFRLRQVTDGVETYDNQANPSNFFDNAIDITSSSPFFDAPVAFSGVSAHWGAENTLKYFQDNFGRDSYDDQSAVLISYVNVNEEWNNATWNGSVMQYGEGDGVNFSPLVELDVVGHEITHGVTEFSANLVYRNEPGALNESFSDIFGEMVENFASGSNDWLLGATIDLQGDGIRSFIDPNSDNQPDTYLGDLWFTGGGDNGGVHFNSGVQNKWFYILAVGELGINDNGEAYDVEGIGIDSAQQIAYRNLTTYLGVNSQYQDARNGAVKAAIDIFGPKSPEHLATDAAWAAVGVYSEDVFITEVTEVVPGSMIFHAETTGTIPLGEPRNALIELDAGQTMSILVEGKGGVNPTFTVEDPNGNVVGTATENGFRAAASSIPVDVDGEYTIVVDTANGAVGDFKIQVVLNGSLEGEIAQSLDNGELGAAQDINSSALDLPAISANRLGLYGAFEVSEIPSFINDGFESGSLDGSWSTNSTHSQGRIRILDTLAAGEGSYAMYMDTTASGFENLNEAVWTVDLSGLSSPFLNFYHASFNDENTELPGSFSGTTDGDGVSVSADGLSWYTILTDSVTEPGEWNQFSINLGDLATNVGIDLTSNFKIKFQQFDDDILGADGRGYDGISITATSQSEDWYAFDLAEDEVASLAVGKTNLTGRIGMEVYDPNGALVATGTPGVGVESRVNQMVAATAGTYYVRLTGSATPYGLVVTRGADFDTGSTATTPQNVNLPKSVIGFVDTVNNSTADPDAAPDKTVLDNFFAGVTLSNNVTGGSVYAVRSPFEAPSGIHVFGPSATNASGWQNAINELRADFDILQTNVSIQVGAQESAGDVGYIKAFDINGNEIDEQVSRRLTPGETQTLRVTSSSRQIAYIVAGGFKNDVAPLDNLKFEVPEDASDFYSIDVQANQQITVDATFPGAGPLLFENTLVGNGVIQLRMQLLDSAGQVVASGIDNLSYFTANGGTYTVRVSAAAGAGDYHLGFTAETQSGRINIGDLGLGVAVDDAATGKGYLMYSLKSVFNRFFRNQPPAGNADHVIAVRYNASASTWEYNDDTAWRPFTYVLEDRLLAIVNFDTDQVESLDGLAGVVHGIPQGYESGDLTFTANMWDSSPDVGEFGVAGTYIFPGNDVEPTTSIGDPGFGIGVHDSATGTGFIMFSEEIVYDRFAANQPRQNGAEHMVAVRFDQDGSNTWQYSNNFGWVTFSSVATDRLIAAVDFSADTIAAIEGVGGTVNGIHKGFFDSDLVFEANKWNGNTDAGEFQVTGTQFKTSGFSYQIGALGNGIRGIDDATGTGYIMYSQQVVHQRFSSNSLHGKAARNLVIVRLNGNTWEYSDDTVWTAFTPAEGDRLIAALDFDAHSVTSLAGTGGTVNGIDSGFFDSNLRFRADSWAGSFDAGEYQVKGNSFIA